MGEIIAQGNVQRGRRCSVMQLSMAGLTKAEVAVVQKSWAPVSKNWDATHGETYLINLFTSYPHIKATFPYGHVPNTELVSRPKFRQHVEKFGLYFSELIASLSSDEKFREVIDQLVSDHVKRNLTHMPDFNSSFDILFSIIMESAKPDKATTVAWRKTIQGIGKTMSILLKDYEAHRNDHIPSV